MTLTNDPIELDKLTAIGLILAGEHKEPFLVVNQSNPEVSYPARVAYVGVKSQASAFELANYLCECLPDGTVVTRNGFVAAVESAVEPAEETEARPVTFCCPECGAALRVESQS